MYNSIYSRKNELFAQFTLLQAIRTFFTQHHFLDVLTPPVVENPGMESHIHPFQLRSVVQQKNRDLFLHTSPEFHMKELLACGFDNIFTMSYCFRDEPSSDIHRNQFIMLEWYRTQANYIAIMQDIEQLIPFAINFLQQHKVQTKIDSTLKMPRITIQELFLEILKIDILNFLKKDDLYNKIQKDFSHIPLPHKTDDLYSWDDLYFLLFLNEIEPILKQYPYILLYEFPHHLAALSTLKKEDPRVCERFEVYMHGIELCNCFNELRDIKEQKRRFAQQTSEKQQLYNYKLPEPQVLYQALEQGLPPAAGVALGVERLLAVLTDVKNVFYY